MRASWDDVTSDSVIMDLEVEDEDLEEKMNNLYDYSYVVQLKSTKEEFDNYEKSVGIIDDIVKLV